MGKYVFASEAAKQARVDEVYEILSNQPDLPESSRIELETELAVLTDDRDYLDSLPPGTFPTVEVTEPPLHISPRSPDPKPTEPPATPTTGQRVKSMVYTMLAVTTFGVLPSIGLVGCIFGLPGGCVPEHEVGTQLGQPSKLSTGGTFFESMEATALLGSYSTADNGNIVRRSWSFSVADRTTYDALQDAMNANQYVILHYRKYLIRPWSQDRKFVVFKVEPVPSP